jgi:hypothetical protein
LKDLDEHGSDAIECQLGGSTLYPETRLIDQSAHLDIATLDIPAVFVDASLGSRRNYHYPVNWPPERAEKSQVVIYGGFPGVLREVVTSRIKTSFLSLGSTAWPGKVTRRTTTRAAGAADRYSGQLKMARLLALSW